MMIKISLRFQHIGDSAPFSSTSVSGTPISQSVPIRLLIVVFFIMILSGSTGQASTEKNYENFGKILETMLEQGLVTRTDLECRNFPLSMSEIRILLGGIFAAKFIATLTESQLDSIKKIFFCDSLSRGRDRLYKITEQATKKSSVPYIGERLLAAFLEYATSDIRTAKLFIELLENYGYALIRQIDSKDLAMGIKPWSYEEMLLFKQVMSRLPAAMHDLSIFLMVRSVTFSENPDILAATVFEPVNAIFFNDHGFPGHGNSNTIVWTIIHEFAHVLDYDMRRWTVPQGNIPEHIEQFYRHGISHSPAWQMVSGWRWTHSYTKDDKGENELNWLTVPTTPLIGIWRMPNGQTALTPIGINLNPFTTSYAQTSPHEDFAESFAAYFLEPHRLAMEKRYFLSGLLNYLAQIHR